MKRTRFAPSLSGGLHLGSAVTAIRNYDLGEFVLRIDDTDPRHTFAANKIKADLDWLGIPPALTTFSSDLGFDIKRKLLLGLLNSGRAYYLDGGAIALAPPKNPVISWDDLYLGHIAFTTSDVFDSPVILARNDSGDKGSYLYHFASVVDDNILGITHVVRGADHVSNTPKHIAILDALGLDKPVFGHLPLFLTDGKTKISKRSGYLSLDDLKSSGVLPDAVHAITATTNTKGNNVVIDKDRIMAVNRSTIKKADPRYIASLIGFTNNRKAIAVIPLLNYDNLNDIKDFVSSVVRWHPVVSNNGSFKQKRIALTGLSYGPDYGKLLNAYIKAGVVRKSEILAGNIIPPVVLQ